MFTTASLARRIEAADAALIRSVARAAARRVPDGSIVVFEANGGIAAFVEGGSPYNKAAGFGFDGVPGAAAMDDLEASFAARQAPLQFEVSSLGDPALVAMLARRGYVLTAFENVLGIAVDRRGVSREAAQGEDVRVTRVGPAEADVWGETMADAFMTPDVYDGPASLDSIPREVLMRIFGDSTSAGFDRYLAWRGSDVAGGATFRTDAGVAQFCGAATLPGHRRRGVQTALLQHRLAEAARLGCDVAVVTTTPGSTSQANVQKAGFSLLYVRALMVLAPPA
jgi:GNAT superfamily N-acetyltransferase